MHQQGTSSEGSFVAMVVFFCVFYKVMFSGKKNNSEVAFYQQYQNQRMGSSAGTERQMKTADFQQGWKCSTVGKG